MKNFKQLFFGAALALSAATFGLTSCGTDNCDGVVCNAGVCNDGICDCPAGYKGTNCETLIAEKFRGTFKFWDTDNNGTVYTNNVTITPTASDPLALNIFNFGGFSPAEALTVKIQTTDEYQFKMTAPYFYNGVTLSLVEGNMNTTNDTIIVTYVAKDSTGAQTTNNGVWVRQP